MAAKTKYSTVSLPIDLLKQIDLEVKQSPAYVSRAQYVRTAIAEKLSGPKPKEASLTREDKTFLEVIAQDHWAQFRSFEDEELAESIRANFKKDLSKPKNPSWLAKAIAFCSSLKRN